MTDQNLQFQDYQQYIMLASSSLKQLDSSPGDSETLATVVSSLKFILLKICNSPFLNTSVIANIKNIIQSGSPKNVIEIANTLTGHKTNPKLSYTLDNANDDRDIRDDKNNDISSSSAISSNGNGNINGNDIGNGYGNGTGHHSIKSSPNIHDNSNGSNNSKNGNDKQLGNDDVDNRNDNKNGNNNDGDNGFGVSDKFVVGDVDKFQSDDNKKRENDCVDGVNDDDNESIRKQFETNIFGYEVSSIKDQKFDPQSGQILYNKSNNKVVKSYLEYLNYVNVVHFWFSDDNPLNISNDKYRIYLNKQNNNNARKWAKKYDVEFTGNGEPVLYDIRAGRKIVVHEGNLFDIVLQGHSSVGHKLGRTTWIHLKKNYSNITLEVCLLLAKLCPHCNRADNPKKIKLDGAHHPIKSFDFCDRWLWDLVDMTTDAQPLHPDLVDSPLMRWILHGKDHFSDLHYLRAISGKTAGEVGYEIHHCHCLLGYAAVFHTDNGTEFMKDVIIKMKDLNPLCTTVTGRSRTPEDQGDIECHHGPIKNSIKVYQR